MLILIQSTLAYKHYCVCAALAEWFIAPVSKTVESNSSEGSNPSRRANVWQVPDCTATTFLFLRIEEVKQGCVQALQIGYHV